MCVSIFRHILPSFMPWGSLQVPFSLALFTACINLAFSVSMGSNSVITCAFCLQILGWCIFFHDYSTEHRWDFNFVVFENSNFPCISIMSTNCIKFGLMWNRVRPLSKWCSQCSGFQCVLPNILQLDRGFRLLVWMKFHGISQSWSMHAFLRGWAFRSPWTSFA